MTDAVQKCRRRFLRFFPGGFTDETYLEWERNYKASAAREWRDALSRFQLGLMVKSGKHRDVAVRALRIESRTNLLFSFEKMALRDATRTPEGARRFAQGLNDFLYGTGSAEDRFNQWCEVVSGLPRRQTRVLTWPIVTVFGFLGQPTRHMFLKPNVTRIAAARYGVPLLYHSRPNWQTYRSLLKLAGQMRRDLEDLGPRDMIDVQSFLWVQGSEEYAGRSFRAAHTTRVAIPGTATG
jgi:hypothetical protein